MSWEPGEMCSALRDKANGRRNAGGDIWGDWICDEAADHIEALEAAATAAAEYLEADERGAGIARLLRAALTGDER